MGAGGLYLLRRHILPNCAELLLAKGSLAVAGALVAEAGISFLGLGDPARPGWGGILHSAFSGAALINGRWWWYLPPLLCISMSVVAFHLVGRRLAEGPAEGALASLEAGEPETLAFRGPSGGGLQG